MKPVRTSSLLLSLAAASLTFLGCNDSPPNEVVGTASLTSAQLPTETASNDTLLCAVPRDPQGPTTCDESEGPTNVLTLAPMTVTARAVHATPRRKHEAAPTTTAALDEAIASSVDTRARPVAAEQVAPPAPPAPALVAPAAQPAPTVAPSHVGFISRLPGSYQLRRLRMLVDGATTYDGATAGVVSVPPGRHQVQVIADYQLRDSIFTYVDDYGVTLQATQDIPDTNTPIDLVAVAVPTGGVTTPMDRRAKLEWRAGSPR